MGKRTIDEWKKEYWLSKQKELEVAGNLFDSGEGRADFYYKALEIANEYPLQASIMMLAVWNVSRFRFLANSKNLNALADAVKNSKELLAPLSELELQTVDFDSISYSVRSLYSVFSAVKGVEYTGTSKVLHLLNPNLFVMWDSYIRKGLNYGKSSDEYFRFLKEMQLEYNGVAWDYSKKTLAKAIDEFNYIKFSVSD